MLTRYSFSRHFLILEFHSAVRNKKKIIVIRDFNYEIPSPLPGEWQQYASIINAPITFVYDPIYLDAISQKLFKEISTVIEGTPLERLRELNLTNEAALAGKKIFFSQTEKFSGKVFKYSGFWTGDGDLFRLDFHVIELLRFKDLNTENEKFVGGNLAWTLLVNFTEISQIEKKIGNYIRVANSKYWTYWI